MKFLNLLFTFYLAIFTFFIAPSKAWIPFAKDTKEEKFKESKRENEKLREDLNAAQLRLDKQQEIIEKEEARQAKKGFKNRNKNNNDSLLKKSANRKNKDFENKKPDNERKNEKEEKFPTKQPQNYYPRYPQPSIPVPGQIVNPIPNTY